jgi:Ca2+-binding RTX toxin-like protein
MATYQFSAMTDGQAISFNPGADLLNFDQTAIAAADIRVSVSGSHLVITHLSTGKDVTLLNVTPLQLATSNITFANGSRLLFGDTTTATAADDSGNNLAGTAGRDHLNGLGGNDTLGGGGGNDLIVGGAGNDGLWGGSDGIDTLEGGLGNDSLTGGSGQDTFVFREAGAANADLLNDFGSNWDSVHLDVGALTGLGTAGRFAAGDARFAANSTGAAQDATDRIIFNTSTLQVFYDADGAGGAAGQLLFTLPSGRAVTATDFWVIGTPPASGINGGPGDDSLVGTSGNDTINGFGGNDTLDGLAGDDQLFGGDGDDVLRDADNFDDPGNDTLDGGLGNDTYDLRAFPFADHNPVLVDAGGIDTVLTNHDFVLPDGFENLELFEGVIGTGNALNNVIVTHTNEPGLYSVDGADGNDTLIGGRDQDGFSFVAGSGNYGDDLVDGGDHFDTISLHDARSSIVVDGRAGILTGGGIGGSGSVRYSNVEQIVTGAFDDRLIAHDGVTWEDPNGVHFSGPFLNAGAGNDTLTGGAADDVLEGAAGNDLIAGGGDNDFLIGGTGNDRFLFDVAPGAANSDFIHDFASGSDKIVLDGRVHAGIGQSGNFADGDARFAANSSGTAQDASDRVIYNTSTGEIWYDADGNGAGAAQLIADLEGTPALTATDIEIVNGSASGQVINGTAGNDALSGTAGDDTINGFGGDDFVDARDGNDRVDGGEGNDRLWGGDDEGDDLLIGGAGNDQLVGQAGNDTLLGGDGDDTFQGGVAASGQFGNDSLDGGAGIDTLSFSISSTFSGMTIDLGAGTLTGGGANGSGSASLSGIENVFAGGAADRITGSAVANVIDGHDGADTIDGGAGDDTLYGNSREDIVVGGLGNDVVDGGHESDTLTGGAGADDFAFTTWPFDSVDTITDFASGLDELRFDGFAFIRIGGSDFSAGDGRFHAAAGATSGHDADDRVIFNTTTREVFYDGDGSGSGASQLVARLQAGAMLVAGDIGVDNGIPDQQIDGTPGDDSLEGGAGFDTINGQGGNDTLVGADGDDSLDGGSGNDSIRGEAGADVLVGGEGNDTLDGLWQPSGHPEGDGELEVDTMNGGLGDDVYRVDNPNDVLSDSGGIDTVHVFDDLDWALGAGLENLFLHNEITQLGVGNELHNFMAVSASARLEGREGNDTLIGANDEFGGDTLDGGIGIDSLNGGFGDDTYVVTAGDILLDAGGTDTVQTDITWSLGVEFENLTMTGTGNITMQGNNLDNLIIGNSGSNTFNARAGDDTILAGGGDDRIDMFGNGFASYGNEVVDGGTGFDRMDFSGYAKSGIVVNLATGQVAGGGDAGSGTVAVSNVEMVITGGFNDRFTGNSGANSFDGRGGNDTLSGGGGNDTLTGGTGNDFFVFNTAPGSTNVERITDFASATDKLQFENAVFTAIGTTGNFASGDGRFWAAAGATTGHDANDRVVYNTSTGSLYYDADGSGGGAAQLIATFQGNPAIAATDITVI